MSSYARTKRIGEEMKKIISKILLGELKDPRIPSMVSVMDVDVTNDLRYAYVYVSIFSENKDDALKGLKSASGFIRREVGKTINLRYTPEIIFKIDESISKGIEMSNILRNLNVNKEDDKDE